MKQQIQDFLKKEYPGIDFDVSYPPEGFGDYSTNIAFLLAKKLGKNPQEITKELVVELKNKFSKEFDEIKTEKNGFINFYLSNEYLLKELKEFLDKIKFPKIEGKKINIEFVSANPTGPLTVGNARAASFGDTLASILKKIGHKVTKEYYINDIGVQVDNLTKSEINKSLERADKLPRYSEEGLYQGQWVITGMEGTARALKIPPEELYKQKFEKIEEAAIETKVQNAKKSLTNFGIKYDVWFKESSLHEKREIEETLELLKKNRATFEKEGAIWLKFGDKEDDVAVLVKSDKTKTYLMNDIAYSRNKLEKRGFDKAINIWGADHYGNVAPLKEGIKIIGLMPESLEILIHQLVTLKRHGEKIRMSKRKGEIETLDDLLKQIPKDVARYFFLEKSLDTHLEFDLKLAKEQSSKNPVYYIQYAFARINSVFEKAGNKKASNDLELIKEKEEINLIKHLVRFPEIIFEISKNYQVHHLPQYALELANRFHKFYEKHRVISENEDLTRVRLALISVVQNVLKESLTLMGLEKPKRM